MAKKENKYPWELGQTPPKIDEHSLIKLEILEEYLMKYIHILSQHPRQEILKLTIVDAFAGGGLYQNDICGSPLRILNVVNACKASVNISRKTSGLQDITIVPKIFLIEKRIGACNFLKQTLTERNLLNDEVQIINAKFATQLDFLMSQIKSHNASGRCIVLLDQYGYSDATIDHISKIFHHLKKAEVILTFAVDSLIDYLGDKSLAALMNLGFSKDDSEYIIEERTENDFNRRRLQYLLYKNIVKRAGADFYTPFFIKSDECSRSYWLFHFSCHTKAKNVMIDLHWSKQNTFLHYGEPGLNMLVGYDSDKKVSLFKFDEFSKEKTIEALREDIPKLLYDKLPEKSIELLALVALITNATPATIEIIKESLAEPMHTGDVIVKSKTGSIRKNYNSIQLDDIIEKQTFRQLKFLA